MVLAFGMGLVGFGVAWTLSTKLNQVACTVTILDPTATPGDLWKPTRHVALGTSRCVACVRGHECSAWSYQHH